MPRKARAFGYNIPRTLKEKTRCFFQKVEEKKERKRRKKKEKKKKRKRKEKEKKKKRKKKRKRKRKRLRDLPRSVSTSSSGSNHGWAATQEARDNKAMINETKVDGFIFEKQK